jgi:hypothetical protein
MSDLPAIDPGLLAVDARKQDARPASTGERARKAPLPEHSMIRRRRQQPINEPLPQTLRWIAGLPQNVQPLDLLRQFPRIANAMALTWSEPDSFPAYLDELLIDRRGNRQGFPRQIQQELLALRAFRRPARPAVNVYGYLT